MGSTSSLRTVEDVFTVWSSKQPETVADEEHTYKLTDDNIAGSYWLASELRQPRFSAFIRDERPILYRPQIVARICARLEDLTPFSGLMIRGPQGVGKSFSLVNLFRKLVSQGHLVAFLPNAATFQSLSDIHRAICRALGVDPKAIAKPTTSEQMVELIEKCVEAQKARGKKLFFIFDQINALFSRVGNDKAKSVQHLPEPLSIIFQMLRVGAVSIISASANNSTAYKDNHEGFSEYDHEHEMSDAELHLAFPDLMDHGHLMNLTGGIPLQVSDYLDAESEDDYKLSGLQSIAVDLNGLIGESNEAEKESVSMCCARAVLTLPNPDRPVKFDRNYSFEDKSSDLTEIFYRPLFPLVIRAYRSVFFDEVMELTRLNEQALASVCHAPDTTKDTKARIFKLMVIRRCFNATFNHGQETLPLPQTTHFVGHFSGHALPAMVDDGLYVPKSPFFPGVDMLWKEGACLWGVQVHSGTNHKEVLATFRDLCVKAGWTEQQGKTVYLLWLSQNADIAAWAKSNRIPTPPNPSMHVRSTTPWYPTVFACSVQELGTFMTDFPWTEND